MLSALLLGLVLGDVDTLSSVKVGPLTLRAPTEWARTEEDSGLSWEAPGGVAQLALSAYPVDPQRPAKACVGQLVAALKTDGFLDVKIGGQPAARKLTTDFVGKADGPKSDENKVTTTTIVGCDGRTKWVLTWTARASQASRFGPILKRIIDSLTYGK
jgi:hypothetical protein